MIRKMIVTTAATFVVAFFSSVCSAYHEGGHNIVAGVAYDELKKNDPDALAKIVAILKKHPQYEDKWLPKLKDVSEDSRDRYMFMLAANWPDAIRKKSKEWDHPTWHYVDVPFKPADQSESLKTPIPEGEYLDFGYSKSLEIVKDATKSDADRAIAICWILHLVGDVHQPMHTSMLFTKQLPEGDKGGNLVFAKTSDDGEAKALHFYWDCWVLPGYPKYPETAEKIKELTANPEYAREKMPEAKELKLDEWIKASHKVAVEEVYCNGKIPASVKKDTAPTLSEEYQKKAVETSERLIMLAGYRLSDVLAETFAKEKK